MKNRPLMYASLLMFFLISFCVYFGGAKVVKDLRSSDLQKKIKAGSIISVQGQVYDIDLKEKYQIIYLKNNSIIYRNESFHESKIIIYDEKKLNIEIGNDVRVSGEVSFFERERNPGNFNQKLYYQKQGITASVWGTEVVITDLCVNKIRHALYELRIKWKEYFIELMGEEDGGILAAMLLAEKDGMSQETKELYQANGVAHVLAISGLHLSIIGIGLYRILRRISGSYLAGGIAGSGFMILYILMIGVSVSVLRAFIMFLFRVGADMTGRHYDGPTALSVAALITVIWKPLYLYDSGFWLSYGAILAIILVLPVFESLPFQGLWASISINLVTLPVLLYFFYEIPLYSVFLNMIVIPLMTVVLVCGLTGSMCCALFLTDGIFGVSGIGGGLLKICSVIFGIYEQSCELFLKLPGSRIVAGQPEIWQIIIYYISLIFILVLWNKKVLVRWFPIVLSVILMTLSAVLLFVPNTERNNVYITMLDVGQGDGIFIRGPKGNTYLIDGGSSDVKLVGKYRIEPFLKSQGVRKIDYVFLSHGDGDHISGIQEMIERMGVGVTIETIVFPERGVWDEKLLGLARLAVGNGIRIVEMKAGEVFREGDLELTCLAPDSDESYVGESNAASMVLALNCGRFDMLFTGDVEGEGEECLTEVLADDYQKVKWEVLKVAHHGSKNSSAEDFLDEVRPTYSVISAGRDNSYGHPHMETIERLEKVESQVSSTQDCGAITIVTDGEKMKVERYLEEEINGNEK